MDGEGDTPVENIWVTFISQFGGSFTRSVKTDENGFYKRESLIPGAYQISISTYNTGYNIINSGDDSPDPDGDELTGSNNIDLIIEETESDDDNNFVLREI